MKIFADELIIFIITFGILRQDVKVDAGTACALAEYGYRVWIAAKVADVIAHPSV